MEYEIAEYLVNHKEGIHEDLSKLANEAKSNPILTSFFRDAVVNELIQRVILGMNLDYERVASVVTYDYIVKLFGEEFFRL